MNTTHSTSKSSIQDAGPYTVIGGGALDRERKQLPGLSIVLLNRGVRPFRRDLFDQLYKTGVREVLSIESSPPPYETEALSRRYEKLRFLIFSQETNPGARIDAAFREAQSEYIFVIRGDMKMNASTISSRVFAKITERGLLCTVPVYRGDDGAALPTIIGPVSKRKDIFDIQPTIANSSDAPTLIPWDYTGIYRKDRHLSLGGFDVLISEPWWQLMEYGMRSWLWGEEIRINSILRLSYQNEMPPVDRSIGSGYRRFFFKTLAIRHHKDSGRLSRSVWFSYLRSSGETVSATRRTWREIRAWVKTNRFRFLRDAADLTALWEWDS